MGHNIAEAIIEDGELKYINKQLPSGRIKVHIIFDTRDEGPSTTGVLKIIQETSGIYKSINAEDESKRLRTSWERNVRN